MAGFRSLNETAEAQNYSISKRLGFRGLMSAEAEYFYKGSGILGNLFKVQGTITYDTRYPLMPT
jgi:hypothetical protein